MFELREQKLDEIDALLLKYRVPLTDYCIRKTHGDYSAVEDLIQDIMLAACVRRDELDSEAEERAKRRWLFSVARSETFKYHQRKKRRIQTVWATRRIDPLEETVSSLLMELAHEALNDTEVDILQMRIDGYSYKEIAVKYRSTDTAMRKRLQRSIEKIIKYHNITPKNKKENENTKEN